ncbi:NADPH:quinone oxidoreductase family protein [Blastococcus sp. SYSU DS0539]
MDDVAALLCTRYGDWRDLDLTTVARPPLQPGQVRIRVRHAGVGFALSLIVGGTYQRRPPLPFTPGTEISGHVLEVAPDVTGLSVGQRVAAALDWGGFAEEAVATQETVYPVPDGVDLADAAGLPITYGTVWSALDWRAGLRAGETVLVHGAAGGIGSAAVQVARLMGARVLATAGTEAKRRSALANGADHVLPSDAGTLAARVKELTGGGVDVVVDPVGGDLFDASLRCVAAGARVLTLGFAAGRIPQIPANLLLVKGVSVIGHNYGHLIGWGPIDDRRDHAPAVRRMVAAIFDAVARGALPRPVTQHFPLAHWEQAVETVMSRRSLGKVLLDV